MSWCLSAQDLSLIGCRGALHDDGANECLRLDQYSLEGALSSAQKHNINNIRPAILHHLDILGTVVRNGNTVTP
jgi:hypothetical protein